MLENHVESNRIKITFRGNIIFSFHTPHFLIKLPLVNTTKYNA